MSDEEIIQQILVQCPEVSREQVFDKLRASREKTGGLIADATLVRLVAAELGVQVAQENPVIDRKLSIRHLVPGLNDATVTGRVVAVYPVKTYGGAKPGKFASVIVVDAEGFVRAVLWNEKADVVESGELQVGVVACFSHGYTKEDRYGVVELHLGRKSAVEINPSDAEADEYASISRFVMKVNEVTSAHRNVNLAGFVKRVFSSSTFTRQDESKGIVLRFVLGDDTGEISVVVWNERAAELESVLRENAQVQLINGRVKTGSNGDVEVHIDSSTYLDLTEAVKEFNKISSLDENMSYVNVEGEVASLPVKKEVKTFKGELVKLAVFDLKDDTGVVRVSAWRNHAEVAGGLLLGEKIVLENVCAKKGFDGKLELSTRTTTVISPV